MDAASQLTRVWEIYIKFYTVFLTVNLAALGLLAGDFAELNGAGFVVGLAFIVQNAVTFGTAMGMSAYTYTVAKAHRDLKPLMGLGIWGGIANAISHVIFIGIWWYAAEIWPFGG